MNTIRQVISSFPNRRATRRLSFAFNRWVKGINLKGDRSAPKELETHFNSTQPMQTNGFLCYPNVPPFLQLLQVG